jgi:hypothetical protein
MARMAIIDCMSNKSLPLALNSTFVMTTFFSYFQINYFECIFLYVNIYLAFNITFHFSTLTSNLFAKMVRFLKLWSFNIFHLVINLSIVVLVDVVEDTIHNHVISFDIRLRLEIWLKVG